MVSRLAASESEVGQHEAIVGSDLVAAGPVDSIGPNVLGTDGPVKRRRRAEQEVSRLDVAMDETTAMDDAECSTELADEYTDVVHTECRGGRRPEQFVQRGAVDEFHHEVGTPVELADVVNPHDPVVGQSPQGACLVDETAPDVGIVRMVFGEDLDSDVGVERRIVGAVDDCERPGPEHADHLVAPDPTGNPRPARSIRCVRHDEHESVPQLLHPSSRTDFQRPGTIPAASASHRSSHKEIAMMPSTNDPTIRHDRRPRWAVVGAAVAATAVVTALVTGAVTTTDADGASAALDAAPPTTHPQADPPSTVAATPTSSPTVAATPGIGSLDGDWSIDGSNIVDGDGDPVQIRGVNWFGFETSTGAPHGLWSRGLDDMLDQIAGLGFNTIRLPFASAVLDGTSPVQGIDAQTNPDLQGLTSLQVMDVFVERAGERGLAIILDRHALGFDDRHQLWYDDQYPQERLADDWRFLADRYRNAPNVIGADLYNEPHDEACWGCGDPAVDWKLAAEQAGDALHEVDPDWLVFVEGVEQPDGASCDGPDASGCNWWGGNLLRAATEPVELAEPDKVVYSPHEYATSVFRQPWFDDPTFPANLPAHWDAQWGSLESTATAPVMVGEFGTTLDADVDRVWLEALLGYMDERGAGFTFWSLNPNSGDTGGILDDDWITVDTDKMALLEPFLVGPFAPVP